MKIVAVSQRVDYYPDLNEARDALDQRLITFLAEVGFLPVPVPNGLFKTLPDSRTDVEMLDAWLAAVKPQAFVLSGGNDVGQCRERDSTEDTLLNYASQHQMPLLGICRGMQMMALWQGIALHPIKGHVKTRHRILGEISGEVNSYHNFSLAPCPEDFEVLAISEDGEIEAIRHQRMRWEGWMWHPEREESFAARDILRIKALFSG